MLNVYSAISTHKNFSVTETVGWGGNLNIVKDPPRSVMTRKITKVGMDNSLLDSIDGSGDRICEGVNKYARGVNPMVSVQYGNYNSGSSSQAQPSLVNKIMDKGSFRPPIIPLEARLPLSRQNRIKTCNITNPMINDYSKVSRGEYDKNLAKSIKDLVNVKDVESRVQNIKHSHQSMNPDQFVKAQVIHTPQTAGVKNIRYTQQTMNPENFIRNDLVKTSHTSGVQNIKYNLQNLNPEQFVRNSVLNTSANATPSSNIHIHMESEMPTQAIKDINTYSVSTNISQSKNVKKDNVEYHLYRNLPAHSTSTNVGGGGIYVRGETGQVKNTKKKLEVSMTSNVGKIGSVNENNGTKVNLKYKAQPVGDGFLEGRCSKPVVYTSNGVR
jgi:hypothetical protein